MNIIHKIFKGFVSNDFENPSLIPINDSDINFLELQPIYNDVGGIILNSPNNELLEDMIIVDFKGFTDGSPTKSFSINAKDSLPNGINLNFYQNGTACDNICNREYIEIILLQQSEICYNNVQQSAVFLAKSILVENNLTNEANSF